MSVLSALSKRKTLLIIIALVVVGLRVVKREVEVIRGVVAKPDVGLGVPVAVVAPAKINGAVVAANGQGLGDGGRRARPGSRPSGQRRCQAESSTGKKSKKLHVRVVEAKWQPVYLSRQKCGAYILNSALNRF